MLASSTPVNQHAASQSSIAANHFQLNCIAQIKLITWARRPVIALSGLTAVQTHVANVSVSVSCKLLLLPLLLLLLIVSQSALHKQLEAVSLKSDQPLH
jgi:hypothetical protein